MKKGVNNLFSDHLGILNTPEAIYVDAICKLPGQKPAFKTALNHSFLKSWQLATKSGISCKIIIFY